MIFAQILFSDSYWVISVHQGSQLGIAGLISAASWVWVRELEEDPAEGQLWQAALVGPEDSNARTDR